MQAFTDIVMRSAIQINVWKTGMKILADYKRRKDLRQYLPHSEHWKLKNDRKSLNKYVFLISFILLNLHLPSSVLVLLYIIIQIGNEFSGSSG